MPNQTDFAPQPWVPRDIATYTTLYFDIANAFEHFGSLFDELFGQGETGVWEEVKQSLKEDPNGPQIDLREDLIKHLGRRVSMLTDYQLPITTTSERLLFAIEATNPKAVAAAIEKLMKNDPTAKRRDVNGQVIWEIVEDESPTPAGPASLLRRRAGRHAGSSVEETEEAKGRRRRGRRDRSSACCPTRR